MRRSMRITAAALALVTGLTGAAQAGSFNIFSASKAQDTANAVSLDQVRYQSRWGGGGWRGGGWHGGGWRGGGWRGGGWHGHGRFFPGVGIGLGLGAIGLAAGAAAYGPYGYGYGYGPAYYCDPYYEYCGPRYYRRAYYGPRYYAPRRYYYGY